MNSAQKSFTLIELLIVISLITIITGAIVPSFNNYLTNQSTRQAIEQIKDDLRTVQNRALNGELSNTLIDGSDPTFWSIEFSQDENVYEIYVSSTLSNVCHMSSDKKTLFAISNPLPGDNVVRTPDSCIYFSFENGDASFNPNGSDEVIVGLLGDDNNCRTVQVTSNGLIHITENITCEPDVD